MLPFSHFWDRAVERHGEDGLREHFPLVRTADELSAFTDDRYLANMTKRVFAAGFRWKVIVAKWDGFEEAFQAFDVDHVADLDADDIETLAQDTRIVRNRPKILSTINNARYVQQIRTEHGSFGNFLVTWPADDTVGLWATMKKGGDRLGGDSGAWFLRLVGRDTFRFSGDVTACLVEAGVATKAPTGKRAQALAQEAMNTWAAESGLSLGAVSVVLAKSAGEVYEGRY